MILVLGGTLDSRLLTERLIQAGKTVVYSSLTELATDLMPENPRLKKFSGVLDRDGLCAVLKENKIALCMDATHPYASAISENAIWACETMRVDYIRLERPSGIESGADILSFATYEEAVHYLMAAIKKTARNILITTGSRNLEAFAHLPKERTVIRVLPTASVLKKCEDLGYKPRNILALQGPFSIEMNAAMMREHQVEFVVTKDSGDIGGVREKIEAARRVEAKTLFIGRPKLNYPKSFSTLEDALRDVLKNHEII